MVPQRLKRFPAPPGTGGSTPSGPRASAAASLGAGAFARNGEDQDVSGLQHFRAPAGLAPGPGYSHAVTGRGRWVATSGQVALDGAGKLVGAGDPEAQTRQVFANLDRALAAAGASFTDVIKLNYYVTDITMLPVVRAIRDEYVDTARPPASTAVQVSALAMPDLMIEIEAWAVCAD